MVYLFSKGKFNEDGSSEWRRQMYSELSKNEKESDRIEADKFLVVFRGRINEGH